MKEPVTATGGYQVINLQEEHTLRHKHYISMVNVIMNEVFVQVIFIWQQLLAGNVVHS